VTYGELRPPPPRLVEAGEYVGGWYPAWEAPLDLSGSRAPANRVQRWFHVQLTDRRFFVVINLADLGRGGNHALLVLDRHTGRFHEHSVTRLRVPLEGLLRRERVRASPDHRVFSDPPTGSFVAQSPDDTELELAVHAGPLHVHAHATLEAEAAVQVSAYPRGFGSLQWWGNLRLEEGLLQLGRETHRLQPGSPGAYDRTVGHRRRVQHWNWLCCNGVATSDGREVPVAIHAARDRERATPRRDVQKCFVWIDGRLHKGRGLRFEYDVLEAPWRIAFEGADLRLEPSRHRHEHRRIPGLLHVDFHQLYGALSGTLEHEGCTYTLRDAFAVAEQSFLRI